MHFAHCCLWGRSPTIHCVRANVCNNLTPWGEINRCWLFVLSQLSHVVFAFNTAQWDRLVQAAGAAGVTDFLSHLAHQTENWVLLVPLLAIYADHILNSGVLLALHRRSCHVLSWLLLPHELTQDSITQLSSAVCHVCSCHFQWLLKLVPFRNDLNLKQTLTFILIAVSPLTRVHS